MSIDFSKKKVKFYGDHLDSNSNEGSFTLTIHNNLSICGKSENKIFSNNQTNNWMFIGYYGLYNQSVKTIFILKLK